MVRRINKNLKESTTKYKNVKVLQGYYNGRWEDLVETDANDAAKVRSLKQDLRSYDENERNPHRIIDRKVPNPDWDGTERVKRHAVGRGIVVEDRLNGTTDIYWSSDETNYSSYSRRYLFTRYEFSENDDAVKDLDEYFENVETDINKSKISKRYGWSIYNLPDGNYVELTRTIVIK